MAGYRNDGGMAIVSAIDSYQRATERSDERKYARQQDALDRRERADARDFTQGMAIRSDNRAQTTFDNEQGELAHAQNLRKERKAKRLALAATMFPDNEGEETDTGIPASEMQKVRNPTSQTKLVGNTFTKKASDGREVLAARDEDGDIVMLNSDSTDDDSAVAFMGENADKLKEHVEQTVAEATTINPEIPEAVIANAALTAGEDGRMRESTEEEFMDKVKKGMSPNPDVPVGSDTGIAPRAQNLTIRPFGENPAHDASEVVNDLPVTPSVRALDGSAERAKFRGEGGEVGKVAQAFGSGVERIASDVMGILGSAEDVVRGASRFTAAGVKKVSDVMFGTSFLAKDVEVVANSDGKPVITPKIPPSKVDEVLKDDASKKGMEAARKVNTTSGVEHKTLAKGYGALGEAKGNVRAAKALMDLYVSGAEGITLEQVQNMRDTGNSEVSIADWQKMGRDEQSFWSGIRKDNAQTDLALAKLKNVGVEDVGKARSAYFDKAKSLIKASSMKIASIIDVGGKEEYTKTLGANIEAGMMQAFTDLGLSPEVTDNFMGADVINNASLMYGRMLKLSGGDFSTKSATGAIAATLRGVGHDRNDIEAFTNSFDKLATVPTLNDSKALKFLKDNDSVLSPLSSEQLGMLAGVLNERPDIVTVLASKESAEDRVNLLQAILEQSQVVRSK